MHMKKFFAAATSICMAATSLLGSMSTQIGAADTANITFDIRTGTKESSSNEIVLKSEDVAKSDTAIPVSIYIPENPGVIGVQLKFQVNDGQMSDDGSFLNYGLYLSEAAISNPYCFDSKNKGDSRKAFSGSAFNAESMNLTWVNSTDTTCNADAAAEEGTTAWSNPEWAYDNSFAECTLVVPKGTANGTYVFDVRTESFYLSQSIGSESKVLCQSACSAAAVNGDTFPIVPFKTKPLTIKIEDTPDTTTTTTTTSQSTTTTTSTSKSTTTTTSTSKSTTSTTSTSNTTTTTTSTATTSTTTSTATSATTTSSDSPTTTTSTTTSTTTTSATVFTGNAEYKVYDDGKYYWNIADVAGKAGDKVEVPVYVYGDPGTAGLTCYFDVDPALEYVGIEDGGAYLVDPTINAQLDPMLVTFVTMRNNKNSYAADGACVFTFTFKIPEGAEAGTVYPIVFADKGDDGQPPKFRDIDNNNLNISCVSGSITVVADDQPCMNYSSYTFTEVGETVDLALVNTDKEVTWSTSDEAVATVTDNGFVTCVSLGDAVITATCGDKQYTCNISGGLFGDVDGNGKVDADDSGLALRAYLNSIMGSDSGLTEKQFQTARVNNTFDKDGNPVVTADDANNILLYYLQDMMGSSPSWKAITNNPNAPF